MISPRLDTEHFNAYYCLVELGYKQCYNLVRATSRKEDGIQMISDSSGESNLNREYAEGPGRVGIKAVGYVGQSPVPNRDIVEVAQANILFMRRCESILCDISDRIAEEENEILSCPKGQSI